MRDKFKILAAASLSPQAHTLSYLFLADDPAALVLPILSPSLVLMPRPHHAVSTENKRTIVESREQISFLFGFLIEKSIYVY